MKSKILIENDVFSEDEQNPKNSSIVASKYFDVLEVNSLFDVDKFSNEKIIFYRGSFAVASCLRRDHKFFDKPSFFNCQNWVPPLKNYYINRYYNFADMERCLDLNFPLFIRPCSGSKLFSGQLFTSKDNFNTEYTFTTVNRNISKYEMCLYSKPKKIVEEYRCVFVDKQLVAACGYLKDGERYDFACPKNAIDLANTISKSSYFDIPNFVIDICKDSDDNFFLLEINSINNASFYTCDLHAIYESLSEYFNSINYP
jgi:hypothetical protein